MCSFHENLIYSEKGLRMNQKCFLETEGSQIIFDLSSLPTKKELDLVVHFRLDPQMGRFCVSSIPTFIAINDLQRLISYFEEHITDLRNDPDSQSHTFVPLGLGFQLQALSGEIFTENKASLDGEFTLRFMINVGRSHNEATSVYVGGEMVVTLTQIQDFIMSLQMTVRELSYPSPIMTMNHSVNHLPTGLNIFSDTHVYAQ